MMSNNDVTKTKLKETVIRSQVRLVSIKKKNEAYVNPVTSSDDVSVCNSCNSEKEWFMHKCHVTDMSESYGCSKCDNICVFCVRDEY